MVEECGALELKRKWLFILNVSRQSNVRRFEMRPIVAFRAIAANKLSEITIHDRKRTGPHEVGGVFFKFFREWQAAVSLTSSVICHACPAPLHFLVRRCFDARRCFAMIFFNATNAVQRTDRMCRRCAKFDIFARFFVFFLRAF